MYVFCFLCESKRELKKAFELIELANMASKSARSAVCLKYAVCFDDEVEPGTKLGVDSIFVIQILFKTAVTRGLCTKR